MRKHSICLGHVGPFCISTSGSQVDGIAELQLQKVALKAVAAVEALVHSDFGLQVSVTTHASSRATPDFQQHWGPNIYQHGSALCCSVPVT